jgi:hypothetical protein
VSTPATVRSPDRILEAVIEGLLAVDVPEVDETILRAAASAAAAQAAGMPDLTRLGVRLVGTLVLAVCLLPARGNLARLPAERRGRLVAKLGRLPLIGEYVRLARGLGLVSYYDLVGTS